MTNQNTVDTTVWFRIAVVYFAVAVGLGVWMGASGDHTLFSVHAHINLLGWVSLALMGLIYRLMPAAGANKLARAHFWIYNLLLPVMMLALALKLKGQPQFEPVLGLTSAGVGIAVLLFAINVLWFGRARA